VSFSLSLFQAVCGRDVTGQKRAREEFFFRNLFVVFFVDDAILLGVWTLTQRSEIVYGKIYRINYNNIAILIIT